MTQHRFGRGASSIHLYGLDLIDPWRQSALCPEEVEDWWGEVAPPALVHRPVLGEWDDPTWIGAEVDPALYALIREADIEAGAEGCGGSRQTGFVYYAQHRGSGLIKIGTSFRPERRCTALQSALLATEAGGRIVEARRHQQFVDDRVEGEWFQASAALCDHIASLGGAAEVVVDLRERATA